MTNFVKRSVSYKYFERKRYIGVVSMGAKCNPRGCRTGVIFSHEGQWHFRDRHDRREYEKRLKKQQKKAAKMKAMERISDKHDDD